MLTLIELNSTLLSAIISVRRREVELMSNMPGHEPAAILRSALYALVLSILTGILSGGVCVFFYVCTQLCESARISHEWFLYLLPAAGLCVVLLYDKAFCEKDLSAGALFRHVQDGNPVSAWLAPLIAMSTCLAYLTGGSVGRVGSALQIGGGVANGVIEEKLPALSFPRAPLVLTVCGLSCGFTAILNTPLAGAFFGVELLVLSRRDWILLIPSAVSSFITWGIAALFHVSYVDFTVGQSHFEGLDPTVCLKLALVVLSVTVLARLYCYSRRLIAWGMARIIKDPFLRVIAGTVLIILLTKLSGSMDQNGIGFTYVAGALNGNSSSSAFFWKLLLTVLTLGCGIRGGEVAPNIFIGATFGCAAAALIGVDPCLCAAVCLVGQLSSVTNCTIAIFIYGCEALCAGLPAVICFASVSVIAHALSGDIGLFREQPSQNIPFKLHIR